MTANQVPFLRGFRRGLPAAAFALVVVLSPALRAQETVVDFDPAHTKVEFTLGATVHTVHGEFKLKNGRISFDKASGKASGEIIVDAMSGGSGSEGRDKKMHRDVLESEKYREIAFTPSAVQGSIAPQGSSQVQVSGVLRLHGQDHPMTLAFTVQSDASNRLQATTRFAVPFVKWGMKDPSNFFLHVSDTVDIDIHATGEITSGPAHP